MSEVFNHNMPENPLTLTIGNFEESIRLVGIESGDLVLFHIAADKLGPPKERCVWNSKTIIDVLEKIVGQEGTILIPSFSYSFCGEGEKFDPQTTLSKVGGVSNYIIRQGVNDQNTWKRSSDPLFSALGRGPLVEELFRDLPTTSFGNDCLFERLIKKHAKICLIGIDLSVLTAIHHLEFCCNVPYRFDKNFTGISVNNSQELKQTWTYFVRVYDPRTAANLTRLDCDAMNQGIIQRVSIGKSYISAFDLQDILNLAKQHIDRDVFSFIQEPIPLDELDRLIREDVEKSRGVNS
jgi:aminoglycoside 3-N-acetyltransferase